MINPNSYPEELSKPTVVGNDFVPLVRSRRRFIKAVAVAAGLLVTGEALAACGDNTATSASTVVPAAASTPTTSATTAAAATTTAVPTTAAATTTIAPTTAAPTTAAPTTAAPTTAAPTTAAPTTAAPTTVASSTTAASATTAKPSTAAAPGTTAAAGTGDTSGYTNLGVAADLMKLTAPKAIAANGKDGFVFYKDQFFVFSNICTHKGCQVPYVAANADFECPCHGSQYDQTGMVKKGPAPARLPLFDSKVVDGNLLAKI